MGELGQIIAIGGGGFGRNPRHNKIENYILSQSGSKIPNIVFIPTASAEDKGYIVNFYSCFSKLKCSPSHINFFQRTPRLDSIINQADIIYVGGGNTKSMLAVWKEWNLQNILKIGYEKGIIMSGVSAGAICWFDQGITDSFSDKLEIINCLGIVKGIACPHYDEEKEREPFVNKVIKSKRIDSCICIEGNCALHIKNDFNYESINFGNKKKCLKISKENNELIKESFKNYDCI